MKSLVYKLKLSENQVVIGKVIWYNNSGKFIEFEHIGIKDRWFTNDELEEKEVKDVKDVI